MTKKIALILTFIMVITCCITVLAACNPDGGRDIPGWEDGKTNIVYYTWGSENEIKMLQQVIDAFEAENSDIHVIISNAGNDYYGDLDLQLSGRNSPDIVNMKPGNIGSYLESGAIISLQDYIDNSSVITDDMIWEFNDRYKYNPETEIAGESTSDIYSLIKDFSCDFVMNYNKNLVTSDMKTSPVYTYPKDEQGFPSMETPMTWSQYMQFATAMHTGSTYGAALDNEPYQQLLEWIQQGGGSLWSADHKSVVDIKNTPAVRQAFEYYRMLRDQAIDSPAFETNSCELSDVITSKMLTATNSPQVGPGQLKQLQAATIFYGRWAYTAYEMDTDKCDTGFAPPPVPNNLTVTDDTKYAGITAMVGLSISKKSANPDAAWKFIEYYFTEGQKMLAELGFNIPGNKQIASNEFLNGENLTDKQKEVNKLFYDLALEHGFVIEFNKYLSQSSVEEVLASNLTSYFAKSVKGKFNMADWEACLDNITEGLQAKLDRVTR